jgi:hypothetical protein
MWEGYLMPRYTATLNLEFNADDRDDAKAFVNAARNAIEYHGNRSPRRDLAAEPDDLEEAT